MEETRTRGGKRVAPRKRRGVRLPPLWILAALVVVLLLAKGVQVVFFSAPKDPAVPEWVRQELLEVNEYSRPGTELEQVNGIVIHYVGNSGTTAQQNRSYFAGLAQSGETYASSHFLVGLDGEIIQCVPLDEIAYCSSQRNVDTISIECCHPDAEGKFNEATYQSLLKLTRWLMDTYDLTTEQVIRHYDVTGKECPLYYVRHPDAWQQFLTDLKNTPSTDT
ncbi:MAG TPA: N-acetylmuramoyl-L-alanine amidase [Candidatus Flavonifractor merdipullorum]|uniref:N-acetylmuramoyl-L-alanine amidase n=1 Tax=Candidatus Flavonifractor merdipullorum TaxID=2838590 RepID=A0A9D1UPD6_9FIRM|nr:N-acetylmuramoyl-L-alanine amidase [Candidatus Flavonifractor merdipullorum]